MAGPVTARDLDDRAIRAERDTAVAEDDATLLQQCEMAIAGYPSARAFVATSINKRTLRAWIATDGPHDGAHYTTIPGWTVADVKRHLR